MRTITLELLRHGPAHNQLLSPLTPYLALCENHPAVTVHVPFEHNQLLHRLRALSYKADDEQARVFQLQDTARAVGDILSQVPGLTAELNRTCAGDEGVTQLRLILSASELALLPFELALSSGGFPGAGQHLLLQPQLPLCLTRESRRAGNEPTEQARPPRILFAAASPSGGPGAPGVGAIPLKSHLLALRRAIAPWVNFFPEGDDEQRRACVSEHLVLLPNASVEAIERECSTGRFTHVHILAHGVERAEGFDRRFYLALHDPRDPSRVDYISGPRLATALRVAQAAGDDSLARPAVVTLASCDSGNVGTVAGAGSSISHALHEAGIPVVVGGQFPLSFEGSVRLVELLYEGLLWGEDPRRLLHDLRRRLYSQFPDTHDWASLTAYVSLPPSYDEQRPGIQLRQSQRSIKAARSHADEATRHIFAPPPAAPPGDEAAPPEEAQREKEKAKREREQKLDGALVKILAARERLERLRLGRFRECKPAERAELLGLIASTEKQEAELLFSAAGDPQSPEDARRLDASTAHLSRARDHYWAAFKEERSNSWAVTQYLSLALVLGRPRASGETPPDDATEGTERDVRLLWSLSNLHAIFDLPSAWAHGTLLELQLLSLLMGEHPEGKSHKEAVEAAHRHARGLLDIAGPDSFEVYSTARQIARYVKWYARIADIDPLLEAAQHILTRFPQIEAAGCK